MERSRAVISAKRRWPLLAFALVLVAGVGVVIVSRAGSERAVLGQEVCPRAERGSFAKLHAITTAPDASVDPVATFNEMVDSLASDPRGGWFVSGRFSCMGDRRVPPLVRLTPAGSLDRRWKPELPRGVAGGKLVRFGDTLYVANWYAVAALDVDTGALKWVARASGGDGVKAIAVAGRAVYVGGDFNRIGGNRRQSFAVLDPRTGRTRPWRGRALKLDIGSLALAGGYLYVGGDTTVIRIDARTGRVARWTPGRDLGPAEKMIVTHGFVITTGIDGWRVMDARAGSVPKWMDDVGGSADVFAAAGSTLYLGGGCRRGLYSVDGSRRYNLAAVRLPSGRPTRWAPRIGREWPRDALPRICFDAMAATRETVLVASS
jgi:hypothetical protein